MIEDVLLSRTDRIGDLILSTPAIATVRASFPQAHVRMVVSPYNRVVMERNDDVDELVVLPPDVPPARFGREQRPLDLAIALAPRAVDLQLVGATRAAIRVGYTYERRWFARVTAPLYVNRVMISEADPELCERDPKRVVRHEVDQLLDLVAWAEPGGGSSGCDSTSPTRTGPRLRRCRKARSWYISACAGLATDRRSTRPSRWSRRYPRWGPVVVTCPQESDEVAPAFERLPGVARVLRDLPFFNGRQFWSAPEWS